MTQLVEGKRREGCLYFGSIALLSVVAAAAIPTTIRWFRAKNHYGGMIEPRSLLALNICELTT